MIVKEDRSRENTWNISMTFHVTQQGAKLTTLYYIVK